MTEIRGQSRITLVKIKKSLSSRFKIHSHQDSNHRLQSRIILFKILIIIYNKELHFQESRSNQAGQRGRSVLQARVITSVFSGDQKKKPTNPTKRPQKNPQTQVLQAGHPPVLYHQAADVLHRHHSSGHNQSPVTHMNLGAR